MLMITVLALYKSINCKTLNFGVMYLTLSDKFCFCFDDAVLRLLEFGVNVETFDCFNSNHLKTENLARGKL